VAGRVSEPDARVVPPLFFGLQMHSLVSDPKHHALAAETAARLGAKFVRDECFWHVVEKKKGVYRIPDVPLENLRTNQSMGLETLIILDYTNDLYDNGHAPTSPVAVDAFGMYCRHMAAELKDLCTHFEIWNEPNTDGFWRPKRDAKAYARLLEVAAREVHQGNPKAVVLGGALSQIDTEFMTTVCGAMDCTAMDVFSIHPYCTPRSPGEADIFPQMDALRQTIFPDARARRPLWVTEIGYPTNLQGGVEEWRQAEVLAQTYLLGATRSELQGVVWYWMGPDGADAFWAEDRFGLIRQKFRGRKPAAFPFDVLGHLLPGLTASTLVQEIPDIRDSRVLRFVEADGNNLTAVYVEEGEYSIDLMNQKKVEMIPLTGAVTESLEAAGDEPIQVNISPMPVLIRSREPLTLRNSTQAKFLHLRSTNVPRGGEATATTVSRQEIPDTEYKGYLLWPGRLMPEEMPAELPWEIQTFPDGEVAELEVGAGASARTQAAPLVAYWIPPGAKRPAARLRRTLHVTDPVELDIRGLIGAPGRPVAGIAVTNTTDRDIDITLRVAVEGQEEEIFSIESLNPGSRKLETVYVQPLPSPDAVLEVSATANLAGGVEVQGKNTVSFMFSPKLDSPPAIDGDLSDWTLPFPPILLGKRSQIVAERDTWGGLEDASARVWTGWDSQWFYIGAQLYDDIHVEEATGFTVYNNDGLEVYFDTRRERGRTRDTYGPNQFQYGLFPSLGTDVLYEFHHRKAESPGGRIHITRSPKAEQLYPGESDAAMPSMILEAAIPVSELLLEPRPGIELGFSIALNDDDSPNYIHPFSQDLQMQWSRQRNAWQRPSSFASLWLIDLAKMKPTPTAAPGQNNKMTTTPRDSSRPGGGTQ